jgi:membrane-bound serine protease (ClpP class)
MAHLTLLLPLVGLGVFWLLPLPLAIPAYLAILFVSAAVYVLAVRAMHRAVETGAEGMAQRVGEVLDGNGTRGRVEVEGEIWNAVAAEPLHKGERIEVVGVADRLTLRVRRIDAEPNE